MIEILRTRFLRILRVPPEPQAPTGAPGSLRVFRAARGFLWLRLAGWSARQAAALAGLVFGLILLHEIPLRNLGQRFAAFDSWLPLIYGFEALGVLLFLAQLPLTLAITLLDYQLRWYLVTDRSLRIRSGIWTVDELTMTYANVQELTIHQGPLQRLLGISDLKVRSAGGGGGGGGHGEPGVPTRETHVGYFHGVDNASALRDLITRHLREQRDAGLGDPDEKTPAQGSMPHAVPGLSDTLEACKELADEARALRKHLTATPRDHGSQASTDDRTR
jgi:membrane protein YdbS with pleckstrin-like domain